ncbi:methyl-accepting chemotaxis protein II, aspartate sensor receptor [Burkholderia multivorans]
MKNFSIAARFAIASIALLMTVLGGLAFFVVERIDHTLDEHASAELAKETELVVDMIAAYDRGLRDAADRMDMSFAGYFPDGFARDASRTMNINGVAVPMMTSGNTVLNLNFDAVDRFTRATNGNATIFVRDGDDFVRVATSVKKSDGSRAVGTFLGKAHPAYASMLKGETWVGKTTLFGKDYMTAYHPTKDSNGNVIGILYIGFDFSAGLQGLKDSIKKVGIGDTGYVYVFDSKPGDTQGLMLIHPQLEGRNMAKDDTLSPIFKYLIGHRDGIYRYMYSPRPDAFAGREKIVASREYKGWGWEVVAGTWTDEFLRDAEILRRILIGGIVATGLLLAALLWAGLHRMVSRPLARAVEVANAIAKGDLNQKIDPRSTDETGQLLAALNQMNESLRAIVGEVHSASGSVETASSQIAAGNTDLSQRTQEQAGRLEETATAMRALAGTVMQNVEYAKQANQLAQGASATAASGGAVVGNVIAAMNGISDASKRIADILGVIDGIAFQTNILALNAAVEAARAGGQGRGFAVVASEVRVLAQRSAEAAKEIRGLISDSVLKVDSGAEQAEAAGRTMDEIVAAVKRVTDIMGDITSASVEQSSGIEQVNQAVVQMDHVTQQNAMLVEEAALAAESMREQASQLVRVVGVFKFA